MTNVLVLGIGNRLMRDDGIGVYVVEGLMKQYADENIRFIVGETDIDYCLNVIEDADVVFIVDAITTGFHAEEISLLSLETFKDQDLGISAHNLHLFHMIPIIYPDVIAYVIGIEAYNIGFGLELSEELNTSFQRIMDTVSNSLYAIFRLLRK